MIVALAPGIHNSAYFEHGHLAQQVGAYPVEGNVTSMLASADYIAGVNSTVQKPHTDRDTANPSSTGRSSAPVSMNSTVRSNLTAGPPIDLLLCEKSRLDFGRRITLTENAMFALPLS